MSVSDRDFGYDRIIKELGSLDEPAVLVGIRQEQGVEVPEGSSINLATIAAINEFGTKDIPSRPFLRSTVDKNRDKYADQLATIVRDSVDGKRSIEDGLERLGLTAVADIQRTITTNDFAANAPSTIAAKGSSKPLIDTGRLRQSIDFEIEGL